MAEFRQHYNELAEEVGPGKLPPPSQCYVLLKTLFEEEPSFCSTIIAGEAELEDFLAICDSYICFGDLRSVLVAMKDTEFERLCDGLARIALLLGFE